MWVRILESKYGGWRALAEARRANNESIWWQDLMEVTHENQLNRVLQNETIWKVGCGDKIRFWEDKWVGEGETLMRKYPRLYQISCQQQQLVHQVGNHRNSMGVEISMEKAFV